MSKINLNKVHYSALTVLFVLINLWLYQKLGVKIVTDSERYLLWAQEFSKDGIQIREWELWYASYVLLTSFCLWTNMGTEGLVIIQIIVSYAACLSLYKITNQVSASKWAGFFASMAFILFAEISQWNFYILTESLFTSLILISLYFLLKVDTFRTWLFVLPLLLFTALLRPMGIPFFLSALLFSYLHLKLNKRISKQVKQIALVPAIISLLLLFYAFLEGNPDVNFYYGKGQIVWDTNTREELKDHPWLVLNNSSVTYPNHSSSTVNFLSFVQANFAFFIELTIKKMVMFIIHIKPYYSVIHNLIIAGVLLPTYWFAGRSWLKSPTTPLKAFGIAFFLLNVMMVGLSVEAWDGRFLIPVLPVLFIFSSPCAHEKFNQILGRVKKKI